MTEHYIIGEYLKELKENIKRYKSDSTYSNMLLQTRIHTDSVYKFFAPEKLFKEMLDAEKHLGVQNAIFKKVNTHLGKIQKQCKDYSVHQNLALCEVSFPLSQNPKLKTEAAQTKLEEELTKAFDEKFKNVVLSSSKVALMPNFKLERYVVRLMYSEDRKRLEVFFMLCWYSIGKETDTKFIRSKILSFHNLVTKKFKSAKKMRREYSFWPIRLNNEIMDEKSQVVEVFNSIKSHKRKKMKVEKFDSDLIQVCFLGEGADEIMAYSIKIEGEDIVRIGCISPEDVAQFKSCDNLDNAAWRLLGQDEDELTWNSKSWHIPASQYLGQVYTDKYSAQRIKIRLLTLSFLLSPNGQVGLVHPIPETLDECQIDKKRMNFTLDAKAMSFTSPFTERVFTITETWTEHMDDGEVSGVEFSIIEGSNQHTAVVRPYKGYNLIDDGHGKESFSAYEAWESFLIHQCLCYYVTQQHPNIMNLNMTSGFVWQELFSTEEES